MQSKIVSKMKTLDYIRDIRLYQHSEGYRVSVDPLLLYDFIVLKRMRSIVDIGAGSGVIGMLLAKKYEGARVLMVELQDSLAGLARENLELNDLKDRVELICEDIREIAQREDMEGSFDVAVSNPPFRRTKTGIVSANDERAIARHETSLTLSQLLRSASAMLRVHGHFFMIYLPERLPELIIKMRENLMEIKRIRFVHSYVHSDAKMVMIESVKGAKPGGMKVMKPLVIYRDVGVYSEEVLQIYRV